MVSFLVSGSPTGAYIESMPAVRDGTRDAGLIEGESVAIVCRWANGQYDRLPALATDLIQRNVAAIFATGSIVSAIAAQRATSKVPIGTAATRSSSVSSQVSAGWQCYWSEFLQQCAGAAA